MVFLDGPGKTSRKSAYRSAKPGNKHIHYSPGDRTWGHKDKDRLRRRPPAGLVNNESRGDPEVGGCKFSEREIHHDQQQDSLRAPGARSGPAAAGSATAADVDGARVLNADKELEKGNWITYHGSYKSWHYSLLDQIKTSNVSKLTEAWSHVASRANRGLQGFPLAIDGVLYYSSPYNQVYAIDGASGQVLWTYKQKLNEDLVARQTHSPYNRGIAAGYQIFIGTLDGKL